MQSELKQIQKELTKRKTDIFSLATNVKESVTLGIDGVIKQASERSGSHVSTDSLANNGTSITPEIIVVPKKPQSPPHSPFKHKKVKEGPVQLLSYKRRDSS